MENIIFCAVKMQTQQSVISYGYIAAFSPFASYFYYNFFTYQDMTVNLFNSKL